MSDTPEFSRPFDIRGITAEPVTLEANDAERAALAKRFGLMSIGKLAATLSLEAEGDEIAATGALSAAFVQSCAVSGDDLPMTIEDEITLRSDGEGFVDITWPAAGQYFLEAEYSDDQARAPATRRRGGYAATFEVLPGL